MLIIVNNVGQLANRMFLFAHFIAHAIEYKYSIVHLGFGKYKDYFPAFNSSEDANTVKVIDHYLINGLLRYTQLQKLVMPFLAKHWINPKRFSGDNERYSFILQKSCKEKKFVVISDWTYRGNDLLQKHHEKVCQYFEPDHSCQVKATAIIAELRSRKSIIVGIHIRRGDYREYAGGKYFYPDSYFIELMGKLSNQLQGNVAFLICTNDRDYNPPSELFDCLLSKESPLVDLKALSLCDYICGPPSTFSGWASFIGKVPRLHIYSMEQNTSLDKFTVQLG